MDNFTLECLVFLSSLGVSGSLKHSPAPRPCCTCAFSREQSWDPAPGISLTGVSPSTSGGSLSPGGREVNLPGLGSRGYLPSLLPF